MKQRLARLMKRIPGVAVLIQSVYRIFMQKHTIGVVGVVLNAEGKVLLVEHVFHPKHPWGLPGGWMERGETPAFGLAREIREETGIVVEVERPLLIEKGFLPGHLDIVYLCDAKNDVQALSPELLDYRWVALDSLPSLSRIHRAAIAELQLSK